MGKWVHQDLNQPVKSGGQVLKLPDGWQVVEAKMLATALTQTEQAFTAGQNSISHAVQHLLSYFDPAGRYAGETFLAVENYDDFAITAADLWAVTTLGMKVPPEAGRALMNPGPLRSAIKENLRLLPRTLRLADAQPHHLQHMDDLYNVIRTGLPSLGKGPTNQWVFASKVSARKRPELFPVRDAKVCGYLANNPRLGKKVGQLGAFQRDLQVFAYLSTHDSVREWITAARDQVVELHPTLTAGQTDLRILDVVLWMQAI